MIYSHYSEPSSRTGTMAPLENTAITAEASHSLPHNGRSGEFLSNLPKQSLVRAHVVSCGIQFLAGYERSRDSDLTPRPQRKRRVPDFLCAHRALCVRNRGKGHAMLQVCLPVSWVPHGAVGRMISNHSRR